MKTVLAHVIRTAAYLAAFFGAMLLRGNPQSGSLWDGWLLSFVAVGLFALFLYSLVDTVVYVYRMSTDTPQKGKWGPSWKHAVIEAFLDTDDGMERGK